MARYSDSRKLACGLALAGIVAGSRAEAQTYRLRASALAQAQAPSGLIALEGRADPTELVEIQALIWAGAKELGNEADALVAAVRIHDPQHRGDLWLGRQVLSTGALRPLHLDGLRGRWRFASATTVEAFGGWAVNPRFALGDQAYDWTFGGRLSQNVSRWGTIGVAYMHRRDDGRLVDHEVGGDIVVTPLRGLDLTARAAYDLQNPGLSEAVGSLRWSPHRAWRAELLASHRSPSRILPATSLFSVLGDVASQYMGGRVRWRAAPRLDVIAEGGARRLDDVLVEDLEARGVLRLDDEGRGALSVELRRQGAPDEAGWVGVRATLRVPIIATVMFAVEGELVRPDQPSSRGDWWPWGLVAATWRPTEAWEIAAAAEASASAENRAAFDVLARVAYRWEAP